MAQAPEATSGFRRRLLGYDRHEVERALASTADELRRVDDERQELLASTANVQRIGVQVAEMLRALADRAADLEDEANAAAERILADARDEADGIRAEAEAVLAGAEARAQEIWAASRQREAAAASRRQTAVAALQVAMSQIRSLTGSIEELDLEAKSDDQVASLAMDGETPDALPESEPGDHMSVATLVVPPSSEDGSGSGAEDGSDAPDDELARAGQAGSSIDDDPMATVLARFNRWADSAS